MSDADRKQVALADLMILVVMFALGMASLRTTLRDLPLENFPRPQSSQGSRIGRAQPYINFILVQGTPLLSLASLTAVVVSLRCPRPPIRRLVRRPGFIVCLAATLGTIEAIAELGTLHYFNSDPYFLSAFDILVFGLPQIAGRMVLASWMVLALAGHGWPGRLLTDRMGCVIGMLWLLLFSSEIVRRLGFL